MVQIILHLNSKWGWLGDETNHWFAEEGDHSSRDTNNQSQWAKNEALFKKMFQSLCKPKKKNYGFPNKRLLESIFLATHKINWIAGETPWEILWYNKQSQISFTAREIELS